MRKTTVRHDERRDQRGAALLVTVLLLTLMGIIGMAAIDTGRRDRQVAGYESRAQTALYAGEAGVAFALGLIRRDAQTLAQGGVGALASYNPSSSAGGTPEFPSIANPRALGNDFPAPGSPSFFMDPDAEDPKNSGAAPQAVRYLGRGQPCSGWIMSASAGGVQWANALWDIRVSGDSPGGNNVDIQAVGANCHPYN